MADSPKTARCWAYRPNADDSTWKLPICHADGTVNPRLVSAASAAMSAGGFRGNPVDIPESSRGAVKAFLRRAWKKCHPDKDDGAMPNSIKQYSEINRLTLESVNYHSEGGDTPCAQCAHLRWGACSAATGIIEASGTCDLWEKNENPQHSFTLYDIIDRESGSYEFYNEQKLDPSVEWVNYLPAPVKFSHPAYGDVTMSQERNERFVKNFENGVYQKYLPIDIEHDKFSGAVGWIDQMRMNEKGGIDAHVRWNKVGKQLLAEDRFRYFSPTIVPKWRNRVTMEVIDDVAVGGALTTRPFFKESHLRPLVASEDGFVVYNASEDDDDIAKGGFRMPPENNQNQDDQNQDDQNDDALDDLVNDDDDNDDGADDNGKTSRKAAAAADNNDDSDGDDDGKEFSMTAEMMQQFREFSEAGGLQKFNEMQSTIESLSKDNANLIRERRAERFTKMVRGMGGEDDGRPWVGDVEENVGILMKMSETWGEDSDEYKAFVRKSRSDAAIIRDSLMFSEVGSGAGASLVDDFEERARKLQEKHPKMEFSEALGKVIDEDPEGYRQYRERTVARFGSDE